MPENLKVGSPYYTPPEQEADPGNATCQSDLYAVGVTLHRLLTGFLPIDSVASFSNNPNVDRVWKEWMATATAASPSDRFSDAWAMTAVLNDLEKTWNIAKEAACLWTETPETNEFPGSPLPSPRRQPIKTGPMHPGLRTWTATPSPGRK